ncbi:hypothetical protein [Arthrobacter sp. JSM 101049]|uniref:hypothetical protein n=1 Tax=Arthrobacter sp. JSM 101049 TaxID=929097 RepID=UPI003562B661
MSETQYPVFVDGQTLTSAELNDLRRFLHHRDRLLGRLDGFGINAGLGGLVTDGPAVAIQPGLGIDQVGEPLLLHAEHTIGLPPVPGDLTYDFIDPDAGGFSIVLEAADTIEPTPECGEDGCAGHAELHTRSVVLQVVAGRITGGRMDFAAEPLLDVKPLFLNLDSRPVGSYVKLRNAIATRLANGTDPLVAPGLIARLRATSVAAGDPAGVTGYTCGWLNMVLFATLDLLRVQSLLDLTWDRPVARPGIVLGWVHQQGLNGWFFDCSYRHAWEPPRGVTEALLGGTCTDPAGAYRDGLSALLAGYAPPEPTPVPDPRPPKGCPKGSIRFKGHCIRIPFPPTYEIPEWPEKYYHVPDHIQRQKPFETWQDPLKIYGQPALEVLGEKAYGLTDYLGDPAQQVQPILEEFIGGLGAVADVKVVGAGQAKDIVGYAPAGSFAPSDTVVLGTDAQGAVTSIGRVAAVHNVRTVSSALPAAVGAAQDAQSAATELRSMADGLQVDIKANTQAIGGLDENLGTVQQGLKQLSTDLKPDVILSRLTNLESEVKQVGTLKGRIDVLDGKLDVITKGTIKLPNRPGDVVIGRPEFPNRPGDVVIGRAAGTIDPALAAGIADFADTAIRAMRSLPAPDNPRFGRYATTAERASDQLRRHAAGTAETDAETGADEPTLARAALEVLGTLRTLVKASGASAELGHQLDAQLRDLREALP